MLLRCGGPEDMQQAAHVGLTVQQYQWPHSALPVAALADAVLRGPDAEEGKAGLDLLLTAAAQLTIRPWTWRDCDVSHASGST